MVLTLRLSHKDAKILAVCRNPCYCVCGASAEVPGRCTKRQAVSYTIPKGGGAYAAYDNSYITKADVAVYHKKQKPPLWQVTVSMLRNLNPKS